jgi:hypothetical protein
MSHENQTSSASRTAAPVGPVALGSPAWLRAIADDREEMLNAIGALDEEGERETKREILGMRDAAAEIDRLRETMTKALTQIQNGVINPMANPACKMRNLREVCDLLANTDSAK